MDKASINYIILYNIKKNFFYITFDKLIPDVFENHKYLMKSHFSSTRNSVKKKKLYHIGNIF